MYLKKALRSTFLIFMLSLVGGLFGYLVRLFLARRLTVAEFGLFYSVITVFMFIVYIMDFGLGQTVSREIVNFNVNRRHKKINDLLVSIALIQAAISLFLGILMIVFRKAISEHYFHADASMLLFFGVIWILSIPLITLYMNIFSGFQKPEYTAVLDALRYLLLFGFCIFFVYLGYGVLSPMLAYLLASISVVLMFYYVAKRTYPHLSFARFRFDRSLVSRIMKFGFVIGISNFIWLIMLQVDTLLITYFMTTEDVGIYQVAVTIAYLLLYLTNSVSAVLYPLVNNFLFMKRPDRISEAVRLVYKYLLILLVPIVILVASFSSVIIFLLFTEKYLAAAVPLSILVVFIIFCSITIINNQVLTSLGKTRDILKTMMITALLNIVLNFITIPRFGLIGAACSTLFSFIVAAVLSSYLLRKYITISFPVKDLLMLTLISVILIVETQYLIQAVTLGMWLKMISIASLILSSYLILLFLSRIITVDETKHLLKTFFNR